MPLSPEQRPTLHCFVAKDLGAGRFSKPMRVSLEMAVDYVEQGQGWMVVGPDPRDELKLAAWLDAHNDGA